MVESREFFYPSSDGIHSIHAVQWMPEQPPRAVVQIVHGVVDHIMRYDEMARILAQAGFLVCGEDHLGHGKTVNDGKFGHFGPEHGWDFVTRDIQALHDRMKEKYPELPYVLLGHSMGSFLVRTCLIRYPGTVDAAILSGTGQESAFLVASGKALCRFVRAFRGAEYRSKLVLGLSLGSYNKAFRPNRTPSDWLTRDEARIDQSLRDPLTGFSPTVSMFGDMMGGLQFIAKPRNLAQMDPNTPIYFFSGDQDPVGGMGKGVRKVEGLFRQAGCRNVTVKLYPGGRHEMFNELNREEVFRDLLSWIEQTLFPA